MKQKWLPLILLAAFVLFIGGAAALYQALAPDTSGSLAVEPGAAAPAPSSSPAQEGDAAGEDSSAGEERIAAPDFTVYDSGDAEVLLSSFVGKPVILNFWASWCGPCQSEMPDFEDAYAEYGDDIHFVMVNATYGRETRQDADDFIAENGYTFPVYYDTGYSAAAAFGVTAFPTTYFIDSEGYLVAYAQGAIDAEVLQRGLEMLGF